MITKRFFKTRDDVEVTFRLDVEPDCEGVSLVCESNGWQPLPMKRDRRGAFKLRTRLPADRRLAFRYLATGGVWVNDADADAYEPNGMGSDNSIISTHRNGHAA